MTSDTRPVWQRLADRLEEQIASGHLPVGSLLPPLSTLVSGWLDGQRVSDTTVRHAWKHLRDRGLVEMQQGRGVVVVRSSPVDAGAGVDPAVLRRIEVLEDQVAELMRQQDRRVSE